MCGRFVGVSDVGLLIEDLSEHVSEHGLSLAFDSLPGNAESNFNGAPTQLFPVLLAVEGRVEAEVMQWGLVPSWSKDVTIASKLINARSETVTEKPSFRNLVKSHRCVVPMRGFYEWDRSDPKQKVPYFVERGDGHPMLAAGLWTSSSLLGGSSFTMLTRESLDDLASIHHRSPVQLTSDDALSWMSQKDAPLELCSLDNPPRFRAYQVSTRVNSVRNNDSSLLEEVRSSSVDQLGLFD
jgi:putative SOS response-associated peptidase YedK